VKVSDVNELKCLKSPPKVVSNLMDLILIMFGVDDPSWSKAVKMIKDPRAFAQ
jgi:hypothetical protein